MIGPSSDSDSDIPVFFYHPCLHIPAAKIYGSVTRGRGGNKTLKAKPLKTRAS